MRAGEARAHARLRDLTVGQDAVLALTVIDRAGRVLVSSARMPVDPTLDMTDRDYFQQHRASAQPSLLVSGLLENRQTRQPAFNLTVRRNGRNGEFDGVVVVSLLPDTFQRFYRSLSSQVRGENTYLLLLADGALLTRWPPPAVATARLPPASALMPLLSEGRSSGVLELTSGFDAERRIVSYQRIGDLPVYVAAGLSETSVLADWYRFIWLLFAFLLPAATGLAYVSWLALQRTRRHEAVWSLWQAEMQRRQQVEGALVQSQKLEALGQLTGGVAHDFNNLLGVVSNNVYLLKRLHPDVGATQPVAAIARATASGVKLTRQLLSFARKHALNPQALQLQQWLPAAGDLLRTTLGSRIALSIDVDPQVAAIEVDASELEIALINLVVNAKHAMPDGGSLRIVAGGLAVPAAGDPQPGVLIEVIDRGSGIAPEVLSRVFEPFFTTKAPGDGTGLGLSQVYGLCVQAGGNARVTSELGMGTTVSMIFPARNPAVAATDDATPAVPARLQGRVLMVEDNVDLATAQEALLRSVGLQVQCASQGDIAAEMAERDVTAYDVVLSDVMMPGSMDGIDLAFRLRRTRPGLPVILVTGYAKQVEKAARAGFVVLGKPTEPGILFAELGRALQPSAERG